MTDVTEIRARSPKINELKNSDLINQLITASASITSLISRYDGCRVQLLTIINLIVDRGMCVKIDSTCCELEHPDFDDCVACWDKLTRKERERER